MYLFIFRYLVFCITDDESCVFRKLYILLIKVNKMFIPALLLLFMNDLYLMSLAIYAYKNIHIFNNFSRNHTYYTRNQNDLLPPFERLTRSQQSVFFNAIKIWNGLSVQTKVSPTLISFKRRLKRDLLDKYLHVDV